MLPGGDVDSFAGAGSCGGRLLGVFTVRDEEAFLDLFWEVEGVFPEMAAIAALMGFDDAVFLGGETLEIGGKVFFTF